MAECEAAAPAMYWAGVADFLAPLDLPASARIEVGADRASGAVMSEQRFDYGVVPLDWSGMVWPV